MSPPCLLVNQERNNNVAVAMCLYCETRDCSKSCDKCLELGDLCDTSLSKEGLGKGTVYL